MRHLQPMQLEVLENQQDNNLTTLLTVLEEEFEALKARRLNDLTEVTQRKQELLDVIQEIDADIAQTVKENNIKPNRDKQEHLQEKLKHCKYQNEVNGKILELSLLANQRFMHFFAAMRDEGSLTYDAKGKTNVSNNSSSFKV